MNKEKILTIHNHKNFSGAARSLGELIKSLEKKIEFIIICPNGSSSKYFKSLNIKVYETSLIPRFNHFELGYYKGLRWFLVLRELIAYTKLSGVPVFSSMQEFYPLSDREKFLNHIPGQIILSLHKLSSELLHKPKHRASDLQP